MDFLNIIGDMLASIKDFLPTIFVQFKDSRVAIGLALSLIMLGVLILIWLYVVEISPLVAKLKKAAKVIDELDGPPEFLKEFSAVDEMLTNLPAAKPGWNAFKKRMIFPEPGDVSRPIRTTDSPERFIGVHSAEGRALHLKLYAAMPDYLVGLGLVLTFLGLVSALYFAAQGLAAGSVEETRDSLTALLSAATFKFITSIAGIASSILFSVLFAKFMGSLDRAFIDLTESIESHVFYASPESVGFGQYRELKKHTEMLESMNKELMKQLKERA